jgi:AcrR family transcriptional regulator
MPKRARPVQRPVKRETLIALALEIADREGLEAVSFRRLADTLGVTPMALYHHVHDKADLLAGMTDLLLSELPLPEPKKSTEWIEPLRALMQGFIDIRERHPSTWELMRVFNGNSLHGLRLTEATLELLARAGFDPAERMALVQQLSTLFTTPPMSPAGGAAPLPARLAAEFPRVRESAQHTSRWNDPARDRELGVELMLQGIQGLQRRRRR